VGHHQDRLVAVVIVERGEHAERDLGEALAAGRARVPR
jgi:hypothetical protein